MIATTVTDANGNYNFKKPPAWHIPGRRPDSTTLPAWCSRHSHRAGGGTEIKNADPYALTVAAGEENMTADFGFNWHPAAT